MKNILSILLAVNMMIIPLLVLADYSDMTDDELIAELNQIRAEILKRDQIKKEETIITEADGMVVTLKGEPEWEKSYDGTHNIVLHITVVNNSKEAMAISADECYINGWKISGLLFVSLEPGMKTKDTITFYKVEEAAEIEKPEDLEDIKMTLYTYDANSYETKTRDIKTTLTF